MHLFQTALTFKAFRSGWVAAVVGAIACCQPASASILHSGFGPDPGFIGGITSYAVNGASYSGGQSIAASFLSADTSPLDHIDVALNWENFGPDLFTIILADDNAGAPGTALETFSVSGVPTSGTIETVTSLTNPILTSGTKYWVEVLPGDPLTVGGWNLSTGPLTGFSYQPVGSETWTAASGYGVAYDVIGTVPEPSTWSLLALGAGAFALARRRRV